MASPTWNTPLDVTDQTLFQIGSITKTFTGTLAMKLVESGALDLDAAVRTYLPDFKVADPDASEKATVRHLMTHTSGWVGDLFVDTGPGDDAPANYMAEMAELDQLAPLGLTWFVDDTHGTRLVSHSGGTNGQGAHLLLAPERHFALAVFTNSDDGSRVVDDTVRQALKGYLDIVIEDPEPLETSEEELAPLVGTYSRPFADVHVGLLGGRLIGQLIIKQGFPARDSPPPPAPPPFTLGLIEEDRPMVLDGPMKSGKAEIIRKPDGKIGWARFGRLHKKVA